MYNETYIDRVNSMVNHINMYYTPLLILLGTVGNLLSIVIFQSGKLRIHSTSVYLSTLAVSDTLFLLQLLPPWLDAEGYSSIFYTRGFCQMNMYASYVTCFMSTWVVVAFTLERYVAVLHPLRKGQVCTAKRARIVVVILTLIAHIIYLPVLKFTTPKDFECTVNSKYVELAARFNYGDAVLAFTVPLAIITVVNFRIMFEVCKLDHERRQLLSEGQGARGRTRLVQLPLRPQHRITRMLLLISTVFVVLNVPAYTIRIVAYTHDMKAKTEVASTGRWQLFQQIALILFNTNFGINFLLYCVSGQNFRRALHQALPMDCCTRRRRQRINPSGGPPGACETCSLPQGRRGGASNARTRVWTTSNPSLFRLRRQGAVRRHRSMPCINRSNDGNRSGILRRFFLRGTSAQCSFRNETRVGPAPDPSAPPQRPRTFPYPLFPLRRVRENNNPHLNDIEMAVFN